MHTHIRPRNAVVALTLMAVFLIAAAVTMVLFDLRKRALEHSRLEALNLAKVLLDQTEQDFDGADLVLRDAQERLQSGYGSKFALDSFPVHLLLSARISGVKQLGSIFIVDADGTSVNSSREHPIARISVADREYFKAFANGQRTSLFIGKPIRNRIDGLWVVHLARPISGPDGKFRGVIVATVNLVYFEQTFESMKLDFARPIALYADDGTLIASSPHRENVIGEKAPELTGETLPVPGNSLRTVFHAAGTEARQVFAIGRTARFPLLVSVTNDEEEALASWRETAIPIALGAGLVCVVLAAAAALLVRELLRQEALAAALREADDRYQRTIDSVMDAIVAVDEEQNILMFNPAAERMFGLSAEEAIGSPLQRLIPERFRPEHSSHFEKFIKSNIASRPIAPQLEIVGLRADGCEFPIESTISQVLIGGTRQLTVVLRDVTERRRAEAELREMNRQLRQLSTSLQNVREQERTRIARELHDDIGQQLTGLKLELSWLGGRLKEGREVEIGRVDAMRHMLDTAISTVRRISSELRPVILDELGFGEAVSWLAREIAARSEIEISLDLADAHLVQEDALATALFRIVQESMTNIVRHAGATRVEIGLATEDDELVLTIRDNGKGIAPGAKKGGIGLVSMRERTAAFGGRFAIGSNSPQGAVIEVRMPIKQANLAGENA